MMEQYSDQEWIRRLKQNDPEAIEELWKEVYKTAVAYSRFRGIDKDIAHNAAVEAYLRIKIKGVEDFGFKGKFGGYCYRIVSREIKRLLGKAKQSPFAGDYSDNPGNEPSIEDAPAQASLEQVRQRIEACMYMLTELERAVIELLYFKAQSPEQAAEQLGRTRNYINVLAKRGRDKMLVCLISNGFNTVGDVLGL